MPSAWRKGRRRERERVWREAERGSAEGGRELLPSAATAVLLSFVPFSVPVVVVATVVPCIRTLRGVRLAGREREREREERKEGRKSKAGKWESVTNKSGTRERRE